MLTPRENRLRYIDFKNPEWIPTELDISPAMWHQHREELERIVVHHPFVFGPYEPGSVDFDAFPPGQRGGERYTDAWGCVWENAEAGLEGIVTVHPLADWDAFDAYTPPEPLPPDEHTKQQPWDNLVKKIEMKRRRQEVVWPMIERFFERLYFLRGYENLMVDFMTGEPKLEALFEMVLEHNLRLIEKIGEFKPDFIGFGDDLGTQTALMMSPEIFRKYLKPAYARLFGAIKKTGARAYLHSDGHILEAIPDLIEAGLDVINPEVMPNTLEGVVRVMKGKLAILLNLDRQHVIPFGTPRQVRAHIIEAVEALYDPRGGLALRTGLIPPVPLSNVEAIAQTFEEVMFRFKP